MTTTTINRIVESESILAEDFLCFNPEFLKPFSKTIKSFNPQNFCIKKAPSYTFIEDGWYKLNKRPPEIIHQSFIDYFLKWCYQEDDLGNSICCKLDLLPQFYSRPDLKPQPTGYQILLDEQSTPWMIEATIKFFYQKEFLIPCRPNSLILYILYKSTETVADLWIPSPKSPYWKHKDDYEECIPHRFYDQKKKLIIDSSKVVKELRDQVPITNNQTAKEQLKISSINKIKELERIVVFFKKKKDLKTFVKMFNS